MNKVLSATTTRYIRVKKAQEHNLKAIDVDIPRDKLVVITGLSGSGKSSLAFDTIYAEGQRRYIESLSTYARQFLGQMKKPAVEAIYGLTPTIAIEQRNSQATPRSTVATSTEIYDYLRVLFARAGKAHCHLCRRPIFSQNITDIIAQIFKYPVGTKLQIMSPVVRSRKGEHKELLATLIKEGFTRVRINGKGYLLEETPTLNKKLAHDIEVIVDRVIIKPESKSRIADSVELALAVGKGLCSAILTPLSDKPEISLLFSEHFACPSHGTVLAEMTPRIFSFNSPYGACKKCLGLGTLLEIDENLVIPDTTLSMRDGAIDAWRKCGSGLSLFYNNSVIKLAKIFKVSPDKPWRLLPKKVKEGMLYGTEDYEGILPNLKLRFQESLSESQKTRIHDFMSDKLCSACDGKRLQPASLAVTINDNNIAEIAGLNVLEAIAFFKNITLNKESQVIAKPILKSVLERLQFLADVGLSYIKMNRATRTLSGGEAQRIKLASQIGAQLSGVTYVLDEPTIGLHQRDNYRLLKTLQKLRDLGNTLLVVEHDEDIMLNADYLIDMGPEAGENGGQVVAGGSPERVKNSDSLTGKYLSGALQIKIPIKRRKFSKKNTLSLHSCTKNNLKNLTVNIPLGLFTCVSGVSGAGKSTLVNDCFAHAVADALGATNTPKDGYKKLLGAQKLDRLVLIDQSPIGRTSRSNPATYTGFFDHIRRLYAAMPESLARGYQAGRFSFNIKGGRCEACQGQGVKTVEMHFLPNVEVHCETCDGTRYNQETLAVKFKGKNISEILKMPIEKARVFFDSQPQIAKYLDLLCDIGLGYLAIGQPSTTLSGGESQRIKLCRELAAKNSGRNLYLMDEPTTGLHHHDIDKLLKIVNKLVDNNNTVVVIEHNLDVIKCADWVIDLGPDGGDAGGEILVAGPPEKIAATSDSLTGNYLKNKL